MQLECERAVARQRHGLERNVRHGTGKVRRRNRRERATEGNTDKKTTINDEEEEDFLFGVI